MIRKLSFFTIIVSYNQGLTVPCIPLTAFFVMHLDLPALITVKSEPISFLVFSLRVIGILFEYLIVPLELLYFLLASINLPFTLTYVVIFFVTRAV